MHAPSIYVIECNSQLNKPCLQDDLLVVQTLHAWVQHVLNNSSPAKSYMIAIITTPLTFDIDFAANCEAA